MIENSYNVIYTFII